MNDRLNEGTRSIALYCRVSTDEQAREGVSLDEQQERLTSYCRAMGWSEDPIVFVEDGYSAKNMDRPQLIKLLSLVKKGVISKVLVTKLDRMSRRLKHLLEIIDLFEDYKVSFISISESFDTHTPSGRLTLQVLGAVAEFERERIRERVFENMLHGANHGKWLTQSPYGYDLINKVLVINETESKIVKRVFDLYLHNGLGFYSIAKLLNEEGIPSKQKKEWSIRAIKLMLTNPVYKGTLVWNRVDRSQKKQVEKDVDDWVIVEDAHASIIDENTWNAVQKTMDRKPVHSRAKTSPHLLGGILKCGLCGAGMSISWSGSKNNRKRVYRCSANKNKGTCTSKSYNASDVEHWFKQGLLKLSNAVDQSYVYLIVDQIQNEQKHEIQQQIHSAKNRYKRKVEAYTAGLIEIKDLQEEKERMERIVKETENLSTTTSINTSELQEKLTNKFQSVIDAVNTLPVVEAKSLVRTLVDKVILFEEKDIEIVLQIPS
ncbi:recombinase family protein [Bacillus sp. FJAT-49736]|uniref:recombinase family protein n=1 Tax=Bacillus sp. FJAT-49736 TaxID=2833582 RepID=UPI001BC9ECD7|nr:recombinase family protein [Bacillus sp. FJAT-49736]MBS4171815.1 recombinase family protein [Bacillus sp. FJAT-49736]